MVFKALVTNLKKYNEGFFIGKWVEFPIEEDDFFDVLESIGVDVDECEEYIFTEYSYDNCPDLEFKQDEDYYQINEIAEEIAVLNEHETKKLEAIIEAWGTREIIPSFDLEEYHLYEGVENDYDLGYFLIHEYADMDTKALGELSDYIDYKKYGRHFDLNCCGSYTSCGYIAKY